MGVKRFEIRQTNRPLDVVLHWRREGFLEMNASYQRGDVWGPVRQANLIRSFVTGIPIPAIVVNDRSHNSDADIVYAVIDGKQRLTAFLKFLDDELPVPGELFNLPAEEVIFSETPIAAQRRFRQRPLLFAEGTLPDIVTEIHVFELINFGGVAYGESDTPEEGVDAT